MDALLFIPIVIKPNFHAKNFKLEVYEGQLVIKRNYDKRPLLKFNRI